MNMNHVDERDVTRVLKALCVYGLQIHPVNLTGREEEQERRMLRGLLTENSASVLIEAIKYGMPHVWPFSKDDGDHVFTAQDLRNKLLNAKGEAGKQRRQGAIPVRLRRSP